VVLDRQCAGESGEKFLNLVVGEEGHVISEYCNTFKNKQTKTITDWTNRII